MKRGFALVATAIAVLSVVLPVSAQTLSQQLSLSVGAPNAATDAALLKAVEFIGNHKSQPVQLQNLQFVPRHRSSGNRIITGGSEAFPM
jgi:hypothetical protein